MGPGVPGSLQSCREGKDAGLSPHFARLLVIFSKTADLSESVSSLKIKMKTMKTATAPTSQCCCEY